MIIEHEDQDQDQDQYELDESTDVDRFAEARKTALVAPRRAIDEAFGAGDVIGEYVVDRKLRETPLGSLYLARHPVIGKEAAIKVIRRALCARPDTLSHLADGARALNQLAHPNLGQIFAFGPLADGRCYFAFDWWRGETLAERLHRGNLPVTEALEILEEICRGLAAAHEQGVLHRDLRPENVFLLERRATSEAGGRVKLYDFALAGFERAGSGPPHYTPPEQVQGKDYDPRSELYSLGAMAYEMLAGEPPFRADDPIDLLAMHLTKTAPRLRQKNAAVPQPLEELVGRLMAKNPGKRPSLREVRAAIGPMHRRRTENLPALTSGEIEPRDRLPLPAPVSPVPVYLGTPDRRRRRQPIQWRHVAYGAGALAATLVFGKALLGGGRDVPRAEPPAPAARLVPVAASAMPVPAASLVAVGPSAAPLDQVGTLVIRVAWPDAEIAVDGQPVARGGGVVRIPAVTAGAHEVSASSPSQEPFRRSVLVAAGTEIEVVVDAPPVAVQAPRAEPHRSSPSRRARRRERDRDEAPAPRETRAAAKPASPDGIINPFGAK